jgi:hypothetical protein
MSISIVSPGLSRGLGWKRDRPESPWHPPDKSARLKLGLAPPPISATLRPFVPDILDQMRLGSCTVNAVAQAYRISLIRQMIAAGGPLLNLPPFASRLFLYYLARAIDHETDSDAGTYLRNVFLALTTFGAPEEAFWPYSDDSSPGALFTQKPPEDVFSKAFDQKAKNGSPAYFRIDSTGNDRILDIKRAIAAGHAVVFGTLVSNDFVSGNFDPSKPLPPPINQSIAGGHALTVGEYNGGNNGIVNSWNRTFGVQGWCSFSDEYLAWDESADFWIIDTAPVFSYTPTH